MTWSVTVRTGNAARDLAQVEDHRRQAEAQGLTLQVVPLGTGGFVVHAVPRPTTNPGTMPSVDAAAATMPSGFDKSPGLQRAGVVISAAPVTPLPAGIGSTLPSAAGYLARESAAPQVAVIGADAPRRGGVGYIVAGALLALATIGWMIAALVTIASAQDDTTALTGTVHVALALVLCGVPATILLILGLKKRR